jgi:hypothetical protein
MRGLGVLVLVGCHVGGGPVVAVSRGGLRIGGEASAGLGPAGSTLGGTTSVTSSEPIRYYLTFDPGWITRLADNTGSGEPMLAVGGTIGYAYHDEQDHDHWAIGVWAAPMLLHDECDGLRATGSVVIGVRVLGDIFEVFASPKLSAVSIPCFPN